MPTRPRSPAESRRTHPRPEIILGAPYDLRTLLTTLLGVENGEDDDGEFEFAEEMDDETTLIEEERLAALAASQGQSEAEELALLEQEGEIPIEQLRAMYSNMPAYSDEEEEDGDDESRGRP